MKSRLGQYQIMDFMHPSESVPEECLAGPVNWNIYSLLMPRPRTVRFPTDRSMGTLHAVRGDTTWRREPCGQELGEARGEVTIPTGKKLQLCVSQEASADLSPLSDLQPSALQMLCFAEPRLVIDQQLVHISGLSKLEHLSLSGAAISDEGLKYLREMTDLRALLLSETRVSDAGLLNLEKMAKLGYLDLRTTLVCDPSLRNIQSLTALELLLLPCGITDVADHETLLAALPNPSAQIVYEECCHFHLDWFRVRGSRLREPDRA